MRITRVVLENYRGVDECRIDLAAEGVTIIEGENEVGKSSLAEALHLVFAYADSSKSSAVKDVQPVHRDAAPRVEVELTTGPYRLVYAKRWLRRPETTLTVLEPTRQQLTGREAHDRVNQILDETLDRDLWDALRLEQGGDLVQRSYVMPSLSRALEAAVGAERTGHDEDELWHRIVAERDRYWMANGRPSTERARLAERVATAAAVVAEVETAIRDVEARTDEMARLEGAAVELRTAQVDLLRREAELAGQLEAVAELRRTLAHVQAEARGTVSEHERWTELHASRAAVVAAVEQRRTNLARSEAALAESEPARAEADRQLQYLVELRAAAADALRAAEQVADQAAADTTYRRRQIEIEQFKERLERVLAAQAAVEAAEEVLAGDRVSAETVAAIEAAQIELARAEAVASAGAATVTAVAHTDTTIEVDGETVSLSAQGEHEAPVSATTQVVVPGVITLTVRAGAEAQALAERLERARHELIRLCARHGVADLAEARRTSAAQAEAERVHREAQARLSENLRDLTAEGLARKIGAHTGRLADFEAERAAEPTLPTDLDAAQEAEAGAQRHLADQRALLAHVEREVEEAFARTKEVSITGATLVERVNIDREAFAEAERELATGRGEHPDAEIAESLTRTGAARQEADRRLASATSALAEADPDTLQAIATNAREARERGEAAIRENHDQRQRLVSVIEHSGEQGLAHRLDQAVVEADRLRHEADRLEARAAAAKLLHDTFEQRRADARRKFVAPFRNRIEQLGKLVFGPTLQVELDENLCVATRTLNDVTVAYDQLSAGAREQFGLISRLACASLVSADGGGAPVVLDDALGWTDPRRLAQMAAAISVASRQCQVIVLTCTPGRFAGVGAATVVRLQPGGPAADEPRGPSLTA